MSAVVSAPAERAPSQSARTAGRVIGDRTGVALTGLGAERARVLLLGLEELHDDCWTVLGEAGVRLERVADVDGVLRALTGHGEPVVIAGAREPDPSRRS